MKRLDLLLVNAPYRHWTYGGLAPLTAIEPPVWAGLIARYCMDQGFSVEILDAEAEGVNAEDTAIEILSRKPHLAAFCIYGHQPSASTQCLPSASKVAAMLSGNQIGIHTLVLGTHPSALPERTLREEPFDFVVQGEGPITIAKLLSLENLHEIWRRLAIPGLWQRAKIGLGETEIIRAEPPQNITDLDRDLPKQAWELLDMSKYRAHNWHLWTATWEYAEHPVGYWGDIVPAHEYKAVGGYASVQTSLSCPFRCAFCCIAAPFGGPGQGYRKWSPASVAAQIVNLVHQYGITNIKIPDEMFCLDRQHVHQICDMLIDAKLGDRLNMWAYARVDTVKDEQMLARMRQAGFRWLGIGIESGSQHVRDGVEKGRFGNEHIEQAIRRVQSHGLHVAANYIFGLPDDTRESCAATLALACELNTEMANFYCAMAYPGSALYQTAKLRGWRLPEDPGGPGWVGYSQHAYEALPLRTEALSAEEVLDIRDEAWLHYFMRPSYISMMQERFGERVVAQVQHMSSFGKPRRKHREGHVA